MKLKRWFARPYRKPDDDGGGGGIAVVGLYSARAARLFRRRHSQHIDR